jgi:hypothetical protein
MLTLLSKLIEKARRVAFPASIAVATVVMSFHLWSAYDTYSGLSARTADTQAVITNITRGRGLRMVGQYSFATPDGVRAGGQFSIPAEAVSRVRVGQSISIVYDRAAPWRNALSVESAWLSLRNGAILWLLLCPALVMLWCYVVLLRRRDQASPAALPA